MPLLTDSSYDPPSSPFKNGHLQTVFPTLFRRVPEVDYQRQRLDTPDDDFLDLDWVRNDADRLAILSHGLEGSTASNYMRGMTRALSRRAWDVLAWNYRGCSGEPNRRFRGYHGGDTGDLDLVVQHALGQGYRHVALIGFSLGGNITLKYAGERGDGIDPRIRAALAFSVPCDLGACSSNLSEWFNRLYLRHFLLRLRRKYWRKQTIFSKTFIDAFDDINTLSAYDNRYTAPMHGFKDADEYYAHNSSKAYLHDIRLPTLLVNAADDPFLPEACYPIEEAHAHRYLHLEIPRYGGHVGFVEFNEAGEYWSEQRAAAFLDEAMPAA